MANLLYSPTAFYRVQFHEGFSFARATEIVPYLKDLGVSHLYTSPILAARPGSAHGYDIVDHRSLGPELGGRAGFEALSAALRAAGLGLVMDIVPNHMGVGRDDNAWWLDVLEWGRSSPYARYFDIQWFPETQGLNDQVLLPVLGDLYGLVLERGELRLRFDPQSGSFSVWYHEHRFPIAPPTYARILEPCFRLSGQGAADLPEAAGLLRSAAALRMRPRSQAARRALRAIADDFKAGLARLAVSLPEIGRSLSFAGALFSPEAPDLRGLQRLHGLLERQHYRPAYWRVAGHEINYRRFFQINDLAGLRVEEPEVFEASHALIRELIAAGHVHGLRIDHIDGLHDPPGYLERLQEMLSPLAPVLGFEPGRFPVYVEKILEEHESLRAAWPVHGTTGYDSLADIALALHDADGVVRLRGYFEAVEGPTTLQSVVARRQVMAQELASELEVLTAETTRLLKADPATRDFSRNEIRQALVEIASRFPVYRTYIGPRGPVPEDLRDLGWAFGLARRVRTVSHPKLFDVLEQVLSATWKRRPSGKVRPEALRLARRFQQFTGPVMAKGMEDTTFYRAVGLLSLNEVGLGPERSIPSPVEFHHRMVRRQVRHPLAMVTTATHDTKRSEDVRARIAVLSEMAEAWTERVERFRLLNRRARQEPDLPSSRDEYVFYQTLVGLWPDLPGRKLPGEELLASLRERLGAYMLKAAREAKLHTSWLQPDEAYEAALGRFVETALSGSAARPFLAEVQEFSQTLAAPGASNALAQLVLRLTIPGVPDTYQGTELWDDSLVDPDNRRPVDYPRRIEHLAALQAASKPAARQPLVAELAANWRDGRLKLYLLQRLLGLRRARPELFLQGVYLPLSVVGPRQAHMLAFARVLEQSVLLVAVPRLSAALRGPAGQLPVSSVWADTFLSLDPDPPGLSPGRKWRDLFTGALVTVGAAGLSCAELFAELPLAVAELDHP